MTIISLAISWPGMTAAQSRVRKPWPTSERYSRQLMKLYAISDLHLDHRANREALRDLPDFTDDWLILGGDICASVKHLHEALAIIAPRFAQVIWVPGNHELWVDRNQSDHTSVSKYEALVDVCRQHGVATPEDPYPVFQSKEAHYRVAPLHLLYDYSFRPLHVPLEEAVDWAIESGVLCQDEYRIDPGPYESKTAWCEARLAYSRQRLAEHVHDTDVPLVLVNHFPLRYDLVRTMRIPRFSIWCGTRETEEWHREYPVAAVISGHLHMRSTDYRDGVRFEEVSLGYPRDWNRDKGIHHYFREILPGPTANYHHAGPFWKFRI